MEGMRNTKRAAVRKGPAAALEVLYRAEYNGMVRLAYTLVGNNAEAEEIVQDSFVEISHRLDEVHQPGAYLRTVVVSRCRSVLRRRRVMNLHPPTPPPDLNASDHRRHRHFTGHDRGTGRRHRDSANRRSVTARTDLRRSVHLERQLRQQRCDSHRCRRHLTWSRPAAAPTSLVRSAEA